VLLVLLLLFLVLGVGVLGVSGGRGGGRGRGRGGRVDVYLAVAVDEEQVRVLHCAVRRQLQLLHPLLMLLHFLVTIAVPVSISISIAVSIAVSMAPMGGERAAPHQRERVRGGGREVVPRPGLRHSLQHLPHTVVPPQPHPHRVQERGLSDAKRELALLGDACLFSAIAGQGVDGGSPCGVVVVVGVGVGVGMGAASKWKDALAIRRDALPVVQSLVFVGGGKRKHLIKNIKVVF
jgi:hypothetical protein